MQKIPPILVDIFAYVGMLFNVVLQSSVTPWRCDARPRVNLLAFLQDFERNMRFSLRDVERLGSVHIVLRAV